MTATQNINVEQHSPANRRVAMSIRIDKNVAKNVHDFFLTYQDDAGIIKSILYYICKQYQKNIFGFGTLDPYEFANEFNYQVGFLQRKHPAPEQLKDMTEEEKKLMYDTQEVNPEERIWDSLLENALYSLANKNLPLTYGGKTCLQDKEQKRYYFSEIRSVKFLKQVAVHFTRSKSNRGKDKVIYTYEVDPTFIENLGKYYLKGNTESFIALRRSNTDDLYIYLKNLRDNLFFEKKTTGILFFKFICKLARVNDKEPKQRKKNITGSLNRILKDTELKFSYEWVKGEGQRYAYNIKLDFEMEPLSQKDAEEIIYNEKKEIFFERLFHELYHTGFRNCMPDSYYTKEEAQKRKDFWYWLIDINTDYLIKELAYSNANLATYNRIPDYLIEKCKRFFTTEVRNLAKNPVILEKLQG